MSVKEGKGKKCVMTSVQIRGEEISVSCFDSGRSETGWEKARKHESRRLYDAVRRRSLGRPVSGFLAEIHFADHVALTGMIQSPMPCRNTLLNINPVRIDLSQGRSCDHLHHTCRRPTAGEWVTDPLPGFACAGFYKRN